MEDFLKEIKINIEDGTGQCSLEMFEQFPRRVKELLWSITITENIKLGRVVPRFFRMQNQEKGLTPIELTFYIAFDFYCFKVRGQKESIPLINIQKEVVANGKKYIVDFLFESKFDILLPSGDSYYDDTINNTKIVIECDGHEFHQKTKKQVEYDNERQLALQTAGYEVIRFSGSQIYKDPLGCAEKAYKYIASKIERGSNECGRY